MNDNSFWVSDIFEKILKNDQHLEIFSKSSKFKNALTPSIFDLGEV